MLRICQEGLLPGFFRFPGLSQVQIAECQIVQGICCVRGRPGLRPQIPASGFLFINTDKFLLYVGKILRTGSGVFTQALRQERLQLCRKREVFFGEKIFAAGLSRQRTCDPASLPARPGSAAQIHLHDADCPAVDVGKRGQRLVQGLLGRAVGRRVSPETFRQVIGFSVRIGFRLIRPCLKLCPRAGKPEVSHFRVPALCQQQICRFDVLMDQAAACFMRVVKAPCELDRNVQEPPSDHILRARI